MRRAWIESHFDVIVRRRRQGILAGTAHVSPALLALMLEGSGGGVIIFLDLFKSGGFLGRILCYKGIILIT